MASFLLDFSLWMCHWCPQLSMSNREIVTSPCHIYLLTSLMWADTAPNWASAVLESLRRSFSALRVWRSSASSATIYVSPGMRLQYLVLTKETPLKWTEGPRHCRKPWRDAVVKHRQQRQVVTSARSGVSPLMRKQQWQSKEPWQEVGYTDWKLSRRRFEM